jgi:hypothetical protein
MLKEYAEALGKKMEVIIYGDEEIKGGEKLFELLNK